MTEPSDQHRRTEPGSLVESPSHPSAEHYRVLVETLSHGLLETDASGIVTFCNRAYGRMCGCESESLVGTPIGEHLIPGPDCDGLPGCLATLVTEQPPPTPCLAQNLAKDGRIIEVQVDWNYRRDAQGRVIGFIAGITDITAERQLTLTLRRAQEELELRVRERTADLARTIAKLQAEIRERTHMEQALRESEQRFDLAVRGSTDGLWDAWEPPHGVIWCSPRCYELLGYEERKSGISWERILELTHPEDRDRLHEVLQNHLTQKGPFDVEYRQQTKAGEYRWFRSRGQAIWDEQGKPVRMAGSFQDITARKQAEETLRQQSRHLDAFFEHSLTPIAFLDRQFNFLRANAAYARESYHAIEDFAGRNHFELFPSEENQSTFAEVVRTKTPSQAIARPYVFPHHPELGVTYWDWTLVPILDDQGEVELLVFSLRNVTARKRAELELQALNESLHQQAAQLRRLTAELTLAEQRERRRLAQVLHDHLQQLLVAARLKVSTVRRRLDPGNEEPSVPQLDELLQRAIEESRSLTVELSPPVLYEAGLVAALEWLAGQMEVKHALHVDVVAHLDCVPIAEDVRVILFQAVRELLFNVVKHAQTTLARIELHGERAGLVEIVVADGGAGFDAANRQTPETTSGGFGLFSIRERLELMGGRMEIASAPGQGTRVLLAVPCHQPTSLVSASGKAAAPAAEREGSQGTASRDAATIRVLLADDHKIFREGLASLLREQADIEVVGEAADGQEAIDLARERHPDVILMDITMPRLDGIGATRRIKCEQPETLVIGLSMHDDELGRAIRAAGATAYLSKHGPSDLLLDAIRRCRV
ncbi:MAG: PAS domain S-box protein [Thermoguttaceae bacterium]